MTTALPAPLQAHLDGETTTLAYGLRIQRTDGQVFAFTSAGEPATIGGTTYSPEQGLDVSSIATSAGLAVDNLELTTIDDGSLFTRAQVLGGVWQNAAFSLIRYNWASPSDGAEPLMAGTIGHVGLREGAITVELRGLQQYLQQTVGNVTTRTCRARFADFPTPNGNNRCGLAVGAYTDSPLTVSSVVDARTFDAPSSGGAGDSSFASVSLLLHFDGANASTTMADSGPLALAGSAQGNAALSTAQARFGASSLSLDGSGDLVSWAGAAPFAFGSGDFTLECWVYLLSGNGSGEKTIWIGSSTGDASFGLLSGGLQFGANGIAYDVQTAANAVPTGQWVHVAATRAGTQLALYIDGTRVALATQARAYAAAGTHSLGGLGGAPARTINGFVDEFRITKGVARYSGASFTAPAAAFPDAPPPAARPADWYGEGLVRWLSGANAGLSQRVQGYATGARFTLVTAPPSAIAVGDTLSAVAGCRKRASEDCKIKFGNLLNFRGEPHLPGVDKLTASGTPNV